MCIKIYAGWCLHHHLFSPSSPITDSIAHSPYIREDSLMPPHRQSPSPYSLPPADCSVAHLLRLRPCRHPHIACVTSMPAPRVFVPLPCHLPLRATMCSPLSLSQTLSPLSPLCHLPCYLSRPWRATVPLCCARDAMPANPCHRMDLCHLLFMWSPT